MTSELRRAFDAARDASEQRGFIYGLLGRSDGTVAVAERAGWVHVRISSEADRTPATARNPNAVPYRANLPVKMRRERGVLVIVGVDTGALLDAATSTDLPNPYGIPAHTHATTGPMSYEVEAIRLEPGRVYPAGGLTVGVRTFRYYYATDWKTFAATTTSLGSHRPSTTGKHRWVLVMVDPATNTLVLLDGGDEDYATTLTPAMVDSLLNAISEDRIVLAAIRVRNDDTALTDISRYYDARAWLDVPITQTSVAEAVQDMLDGFWANSDTITINYDDGANTVSFDVDTTKFLLLAGQPGGQTAHGGTAAGEVLILKGTSHSTPGYVETPDMIRITGAAAVAAPAAGAGFELFYDTDGAYNAFSGGSGVGGFFTYSRTASAYRDFMLAASNIGFWPGGVFKGVWNSSGNLIMEDGVRIEIDEIRGRGSDGLALKGDGGNLGIHIEDGGQVGFNTTSPAAQVHILSAAAGTEALRVEMPSSPSTFAQTWYNNGVLAIWADVSINQIGFNDRDLGTGAGPSFYIGRNSNGSTPAGGNIRLVNRAATLHYIWVDNAGKLRIGTTAPTNANDTSGTIVGTQS